MEKQRIVVLYHARCPDGFVGAYAAWKKFGDNAEYLPVKHGGNPPEHLEDAYVYLIDFIYPKEVMDEIISKASHVTVLDHHLGVKDVVVSMPDFVFDETKSGATIAWKYFHKDTKQPGLFEHIEDDDLFLFRLKDTKPIVRYLSSKQLTFVELDDFINELNNPDTKEKLLKRLRNYSEYFDILVSLAVDRSKTVLFEGYKCSFANAHPLITMRSAIGNALVKNNPPLAIVVSAHPEGFGVSLRSDTSVDVAEIAKKYGGNGHPQASGFSISYGDTLPWTIIDDE